MLHTFVAHVDEKSGVLTRVASLSRHLDINVRSAKEGQLATTGLEARATLAWGNAPGHGTFPVRELKARAKSLVPYKLFIERNTVLPKHRSHLALKIMPLVIRRLTLTWGAAPGYDRAGLQLAAPLPIKSSFERFQCSTPL